MAFQHIVQPDHTGQGFGVGDQPLRTPGHDLGRRRGEDIEKLASIELARASPKFACKEDVNDFGRVGNRQMHLTRSGPLSGGETRFFEQFTLCTAPWIFARIEFSGRQFGHDLSDRIAELSFEDDLRWVVSLFVQGDDDHRPRMLDVFAAGGATIGQSHGITPGLQEAAFEKAFAAFAMLGQALVLAGRFFSRMQLGMSWRAHGLETRMVMLAAGHAM